MRKLIRFTLLPLAVAAVACGRDATSADQASADLQRDMELAAASSVELASSQSMVPGFIPTETKPTSKPKPAPVVKKAAGNKAVSSPKPTVKAEPVQEVAATEAPEPQVIASAPAPEVEDIPESSLPAMGRPVPVPVSMPSSGGDVAMGGSTGSSTGSTVGAVLGGILGAVIRGGSVDGDNCEIHQQPRGGNRRPVYQPNPIGVGSTRFPTRMPINPVRPATPTSVGTRIRR